MLSKENIEEQVTDNQSRLIRTQRENTLPSNSQQISSNLKLPKGFTIGKAIGRGDCFFDAVAQGLKQLKPETNFTVKSLREICREQALGKQEIKDKVIKDARNRGDNTIVLPPVDVSDGELWKTYLIRIEYTVEDIEKIEGESPCLYKKLTDLKYGSTLKVPIWGRPEIEGKIICSKYKVRLHLIEVITTVDGENVLIHSILDSEGYKKDILNHEIFNEEVYNRKDTIHILNRGRSHFEPVLRKTMEEPYREFASTVGNDSLSENEKIGKLKTFFRAFPRLDVNFQVNEHNDTPLHVAVHRGEFKTSKFLLKAGASVSISNIDGKTPLDIAKDNNRKDIIKILQPLVSYEKFNVPGDGSCLFWSVALGYLFPVEYDYYTLKKRFKKLFGKNYDPVIQEIIQDNTNIYQNDILRELITEVFRSKVINEIRFSQKEFEDKISMEDFLEIHRGDYFTEGIFKKRFEDKFSAKKVKKYDIDVSKLQPNFLDENTIKEICTELNKVQKRSQVQEFVFEAYLECMEMPQSWGGRYEINAMSKLLGIEIIVSQEGVEDCIYNEKKKYFGKIYLSYEKWQHYQFYEVKYSNLMEFVLNFVQLFEMKFVIYDVLRNILMQENRMYLQEIKKSDFVRSIFGFPPHIGNRTMSHIGASLKVGNVIKATKSFINLSDLIERFRMYKLGFRGILVDAGCNIFQSFEMQFEKIGFDQVSKLADDIIDKIIEYYIQKEYEGRVDDIGIAEALVSDKYSEKVPGKIVQYGKKAYNLRDLY
ncbi:MAG: ankyrin repeat domain-containing protein, partial [Wolbachia sp.]